MDTLLIPSEDGEELALTAGAKAFIPCSAKSLQNVPELFLTAAKCFQQKSEKYPASDAESSTETSNDSSK